MAQITLNSSGVASNGVLALQSNGTTTAVTISTAQNVGIGTTSPSQLLDVRGASSPTIKVRNDTATISTYAQLLFEGANTFSGTSTSYIRSITNNAGNSSTVLAFGTNADGGGAASEAARIDSSGRLGIGTTSPACKLEVATTEQSIKITGSGASNFLTIANTSRSFNFGVDATGFNVYDNTASAYRLNIDSSGRLLVNTTSILNSNNATLSGLGQSTTTGAANFAGPASYTGQIITSQSVTTAGTGWTFFTGQSGNGSSITTNNIFIYGNGNILNSNNSYGGISDIKLKENIVDATPKLDKLMQVRIRNYNLKGEYQQHKQLGVIAQELETIFPAMIEESPDKDLQGNDLGTTTKSVKYSVFVPMLIKAIQEQQALITQLQADVATLKA